MFGKVISNDGVLSINDFGLGKFYTVDKSHVHYEALKKEQDILKIRKLVNLAPRFKQKNVSVQHGLIYFKGKVIDDSLASRIKSVLDAGFDPQAHLNYTDELYHNPSSNSKREFPRFMENLNLGITQEGYVLAYKSVRSDYYSKTKGTIVLIQGKTKDGRVYNAPGEVIECDRGDVDDDFTNECSHGLHVGGLKYSGPGGWFNGPEDRVVLVKFSPRDVVSVPKDFNSTKVRVCKYEVLADYTEVLKDGVIYSPEGKELEPGNWDYDDYEDDWEDLDYCNDCGGLVPEECDGDCEDEWGM